MPVRATSGAAHYELTKNGRMTEDRERVYRALKSVCKNRTDKFAGLCTSREISDFLIRTGFRKYTDGRVAARIAWLKDEGYVEEAYRAPYPGTTRAVIWLRPVGGKAPIVDDRKDKTGFLFEINN